MFELDPPALWRPLKREVEPMPTKLILAALLA
jgi:hypothetical protein